MVRVTKRELEGRLHYAAPVVMLVVGVHNGSAGPVLYPEAELKRSVNLWNGRPVVVFHPAMYGHEYAGSPKVFDRQRVGTVFNAAFDGKRLTAEAWIDPERANAVDAGLLNSLRAGRPIEVSTGLYLDSDGEQGVWNGVGYISTVRNYRPDHLAILPSGVGACSVESGCGLLRNDLALAVA